MGTIIVVGVILLIVVVGLVLQTALKISILKDMKRWDKNIENAKDEQIREYERHIKVLETNYEAEIRELEAENKKLKEQKDNKRHALIPD